MSEKDFAGQYDENELQELSEGQEHGGTNPTTVIPVSAAICPTMKCTSAC